MTERNNHIDLVEFPANSPEELKITKEFFTEAFGWKFKEWGEEYVDTQDSGLPSGINAATEGRPSMPLAVVYAKDLESTKEKIIKAGGTIIQDTYSFPGGRRFHFKDPAGNELAVWSE
jgi:predicted enzyme related to lactoylglutathione lyase